MIFNVNDVVEGVVLSVPGLADAGDVHLVLPDGVSQVLGLSIDAAWVKGHDIGKVEAFGLYS